MRWYADDSDMKTIKDLHIPNMILFGGIAVSQENEQRLRSAVETAKGGFGNGNKRLPIKWNFRDLKDKYIDQGHGEQHTILLNQMPALRKAIFEAVAEIDFTIIISTLVGHSTDKKILIDLKSDLSRFVFSNGLMRYAQHVKETNPARAEVILDWPHGGNSKPFDIEYACAYNNGKSKDKIPYYSGSLESLGFHDSAVYTRMLHSTLMQFSDMVVGATREFMQHSLDKEKGRHGLELLRIIANKFKGYPHNVIGRGIIINSQAEQTKTLIKQKFNEIYIEKS
jgi:hypothetical protein